jgi:hypothetical protein
VSGIVVLIAISFDSLGGIIGEARARRRALSRRKKSDEGNPAA